MLPAHHDSSRFFRDLFLLDQASVLVEGMEVPHSCGSLFCRGLLNAYPEALCFRVMGHFWELQFGCHYPGY